MKLKGNILFQISCAPFLFSMYQQGL